MSLTTAPSFDAASANNAFGVDLYRRLEPARSGANLVISPFSITQALALTASGGVGDTRAELLRTLRLPSDEATVQSSLSALRLVIAESAEKTVASLSDRRQWDSGADSIDWRIANRLFGQSGHDFHPSFLAAAQSGYSAAFEALDFRTNPESARATINSWVADQTRQKIPQLIPPGATQPDTRLILVNALYLKAPWATRFKTENTAPRPFHLANGTTPEVPTMMMTDSLTYLRTEGFTTIGLRFEGNHFQFLMFLPDVGVSPASVAAKLTPEFLRTCDPFAKAPRTFLKLLLPKLRSAGAPLSLKQELHALGVSAAFDVPPRSADFSAIAPRRETDYLTITEVIHQTFLALDETGIEAAAGTAVAARAGAAMRPKPIEVCIDRPFLFAVQHIPSGACLLLGHIADPR